MVIFWGSGLDHCLGRGLGPWPRGQELRTPDQQSIGTLL